ncbi:MAG: hypothetical protein N2442_13230 [Spirochaetes bacterium]|nr:hypothetical protein [Spirochaetota bacterium]
MLHKINYKATLDFLSLSIQTLGTGIQLDIDPDLFLDKVLEDILFIDSILSRLFHQLRDNPYLNRRVEYLVQLERTKEAFIQLLTQIINQGSFFREPIGPYLSTLQTCHIGQTKELNDLKEILKEAKSQSLPEEKEVISPLEYQFLLETEEPKEGDA